MVSLIVLNLPPVNQIKLSSFFVYFSVKMFSGYMVDTIITKFT